jgi:hypothetical protein
MAALIASTSSKVVSMGAVCLTAAYLVRYARRMALVAIHSEDPGEVCFGVVVYDLCCGLGVCARIHPHVERGVLVVGEAPVGDIELRRGDAEVEEEAVDPWHLRLDEELVEVAEVALQEQVARLGDLAREAFGRGGERHVVLVDPDGEPLRGDPPCELDRMPGPSEGAVADRLPPPWAQVFENLLEHDWYVPIFSCQDLHPGLTRHRAARRGPRR